MATLSDRFNINAQLEHLQVSMSLHTGGCWGEGRGRGLEPSQA